MLSLIPVLGALDPVALFRALPGSVSQGLIWGIMSIGVYITFKILDFADLTVDGSFATGGAVTVMMTINGHSIWVHFSVPASPDFLPDFAPVCYIPSSVFHRSLPVS